MAVALTTTLRSLRASISPTLIGSVCIFILALLAVLGSTILAGTKTGFVLSLLAVAGPLAFYAALRNPLIFPFCLFVLLVPFDNLLMLSSFGTLTKLLAIVSGAAISFWLLYRHRCVVPDRPLLMWGLFFAWILASLAWAIDPSIAYPHVVTFASLYLLYAVISFVPVSAPALRAILISVCAGATLAGVYGAYLFRHGIDVSKDGRLLMGNGDNLIDPNQFAAALILPFALSLTFAVNSRNWWLRAFALAAILFIATGLALCGSRGGLLAIVATFIVLTLRSKRYRGILAFVGIAALGTVLAAYGNVLSRFGSATQTGGAGRTSIWEIGFAAFKHSPLIGYGYANFPLAYDKFFLLVPEHYFTNWDRAPHNVLLQTATELGVIGVALLLIAFWTQLRSLRVIASDHPLYPIRVALEASYAGALVASIFIDMLEYKYLWLLLITTVLVRNAAITQGARLHERSVSPVLQTAPHGG